MNKASYILFLFHSVCGFQLVEPNYYKCKILSHQLVLWVYCDCNVQWKCIKTDEATEFQLIYGKLVQSILLWSVYMLSNRY